MNGAIVPLLERVLVATVALAIVVWAFGRRGRARCDADHVALVEIALLIAGPRVGSPRPVLIDGRL